MLQYIHTYIDTNIDRYIHGYIPAAEAGRKVFSLLLLEDGVDAPAAAAIVEACWMDSWIGTYIGIRWV